MWQIQFHIYLQIGLLGSQNSERITFDKVMLETKRVQFFNLQYSVYSLHVHGHPLAALRLKFKGSGLTFQFDQVRDSVQQQRTVRMLKDVRLPKPS